AMTQAQTAGIVVNRVLDFLGTDIPPKAPGARASAALVLVQQPGPGAPVDPALGAQLVVAVPPEVEQAIEMPSLIGLTESEARRTLEQLGLVLGRVKVATPPTQGARSAPRRRSWPPPRSTLATRRCDPPSCATGSRSRRRPSRRTACSTSSTSSRRSAGSRSRAC